MEFSFYFPIWNQLDDAQKKLLQQSAVFRQVRKGTVIHNGSENCTGLLLLGSGQLRAYILSDEGREITIYRLLAHDICLFSASCMMNSIQFEISVEAEKDEFRITFFYKKAVVDGHPRALEQKVDLRVGSYAEWDA